MSKTCGNVGVATTRRNTEIAHHRRAATHADKSVIDARRADYGFYAEYSINLQNVRKDSLEVWAPAKRIYAVFSIKPDVRMARINHRQARVAARR
jgi:hypothetical protein